MSYDGFNIVVLGATGSPEEWGQALRTPASDLPPLDAEQRENAKRRGVSEQDYARGVLLENLAEKKWQDRAQAIGEIIREVLKPIESEYRLVGIVAEVLRNRWTVRFEGVNVPVDVHLDDELVDDLVHFSALEDRDKLRRKLLKGLGREDLIVQG
jgi:hypothetical protein